VGLAADWTSYLSQTLSAPGGFAARTIDLGEAEGPEREKNGE
jgi:hypothetical protein